MLRTASLAKPGTQPGRYFLTGEGGARENLEEQIFFRLLYDCMIGNTNNIVLSNFLLLQCEEDFGLFAIYQCEILQW